MSTHPHVSRQHEPLHDYRFYFTIFFVELCYWGYIVQINLCNEEGCGLKRSEPCIICIIQHLLFLRENPPEKRSNRFWNVKNCKVFQRSKCWGAITEPSSLFLQIAQKVARNVLREKDTNELPKMREESNKKLAGTHYPPVLRYSRAATYVECPGVQAVQCSETQPR